MIEWLRERVKAELAESAKAVETPKLEAVAPVIVKKDHDDPWSHQRHPALIAKEEQIVIIDPKAAERLANEVADAFALQRNQVDDMRLWVRVDMPGYIAKAAAGTRTFIRISPDYSIERTSGMEWWRDNIHLRYAITRALWQHGFILTSIPSERHSSVPIDHIELRARTNNDTYKTWNQYLNSRGDLQDGASKT